ncbi:uncharacterized protein EV422DRAFT_243290 [Fimicolochytrium jonesii]|uniref:uncharacterized protein n=1 Tax=Fimicolochytrium jonesii TaxID=1396493 RepID=UPI0022FEC730|nr:uncharacterized protein EV422DRAFT_243290 [Fimicolochytrium jonesii]KAI8825044.1 hypothetical protein EV422DRAFT_243290 [Fimicolochytrium jonesii]
MPTEIPPSPTTPTISIDASSPLMSPIPNKSLLSTKGVERPLGHSRDNSEDSINTRSGGGTAAFFGANLSAAERDIEIKRIIFTAINNGDTAGLREFLAIYPGATEVLQLLLTTTYPNTDLFYQLDEEVLNDAAELLGPSMTHLNAIQIACVLSEEDIALDILDFVARVTEEIESRKVLYEFMGRVWGNGNTVVHLASFQGMSELVKRLLQLGAASRKRNDRGYRPVDCADDQVTTLMFSTVNEADADRSPPSISSHSSLLSPQNSNVALSPILETSPAQAHYGSITEFLQSRPRGSERQTSLPTLFPDASTQESLAAASGGDYKPPAVKRQKSLSVDGGKLGPQVSLGVSWTGNIWYIA